MRNGFVYLVGAGPGDPGLLTIKGQECLQQADVVIYDRLVHPHLLQLAPPSCEKIYVGKEASNHFLPQEKINQLLVEKGRAGKTVVRLKGGDPFVFGRGGEEAEVLLAAGIPFTVVPGVTSAVAVPAYAGIPVTHRELTSSFTVVTGHEDPSKNVSALDWERLARGTDTLIFLMGVKNLPVIVEQLLNHGKSPRTPVALIRWGTWVEQETITGSLEDIVKRVQTQQFRPPAVIIIGDVVRLRDKLYWREKQPLFGQRVLITRTREQGSRLAAEVRRLGGEPLELPVIQIKALDDYARLDAALEHLPGYHWVLFTSPNGVDFFWQRLANAGKDSRALGGSKVAAVGDGTAAALKRQGIWPDLVPAENNAEGLARALAGESSGKVFLFPRALEGREVLVEAIRAQGGIVDVVPAYRTVPADDAAEGVQKVLRLIGEGKVQWLTFASSSAVKNFAALLQGRTAIDGLQGCKVACIGEITAAAAREAGFPVHVVPRRPVVEELVQEMAAYCKMR